MPSSAKFLRISPYHRADQVCQVSALLLESPVRLRVCSVNYGALILCDAPNRGLGQFQRLANREHRPKPNSPRDANVKPRSSNVLPPSGTAVPKSMTSPLPGDIPAATETESGGGASLRLIAPPKALAPGTSPAATTRKDRIRRFVRRVPMIPRGHLGPLLLNFFIRVRELILYRTRCRRQSPQKSPTASDNDPGSPPLSISDSAPYPIPRDPTQSMGKWLDIRN